jgi:AcrR family transcriptional regulator
VAHEAGVSKGGLIYHFPSKEAMIQAMVARLVERIEQSISVQWEHAPDRPGRALRAYLASDSDQVRPPIATQNARAALIAAVANDPRLLQPVTVFYRNWFTSLEHGDVPWARAAVLTLANDALSIFDLFGLNFLTDEERQSIRQELEQLIETGTSGRPD